MSHDSTDFSGYRQGASLEHGHALAMEVVRSMLGDEQLCLAIQDAVGAGITFALGYGIALGTPDEATE